MKTRRSQHVGGAASFIAEQREAIRYTDCWHQVYDWAWSVVEQLGSPEVIPTRSPRITVLDGHEARDLFDPEEAEPLAVDLAALWIELGPKGACTGHRRVIIRVFSWIVDENAGGALYQPQWITTGEGISAKSASAAHNRYVRAYSQAVDHGVESRLLSVTAIQVLWWTMSHRNKFV